MSLLPCVVMLAQALMFIDRACLSGQNRGPCSC